MKRKQILKRAISKAVKNGWEGNNYKFDLISKNGGFLTISGYLLKDIKEFPDYKSKIGSPVIKNPKVNDIIFNHDFCKAFFGTKILDIRDLGFEPITNKTKTVAWKFHLLALVLCKKRLKYLEKYL